ncbi:MAG: hypothetical protein H7256_03255 [Bdellovibrio sp.]|nr:hypothetical protein [Bdellovibrio sp.]
MTKLKYTLCTFALIFSSSAFSAQEDWLQFSNAPQCAADMSKPTNSVFLALTFRDIAQMLKQLAPQIGQEPTSFIKEGNRLYKLKINTLAEQIIRGLDSGELAPINKNAPSEIKRNWNALTNKASLQTIDSIACYQVNDINTYYSHLFIRGINQSTLEELAKQFIAGSTRVKGCGVDAIKADADFYPVFNYDLKIKNQKLWEQKGYDFWTSFKIYLSWAWRNVKMNDPAEGPYRAVFLAAPIEEQMVILSNGCKSISRPECSSDFLSSTELRSLFTTDRKKLDLTSSTLEMKDNVIDNNDDIDQKVQEQMAMKAGENEWIRSFQKSYLGFTQANLDKLNQTNVLFSSILAKKGVAQLKADLKTAFADKANSENLYYMCVEARLIGQERPLSIFKFDLDFMKQQGASLNQFLKYGLTVEEMMSVYEKLSPSLITSCGEFDKGLTSKDAVKENWLNYRPWYKSYLSRYKILKDYIDFETEQTPQLAQVTPTNLNYVNGQCSDSIDCTRKVIEGMVTLNKVLLHSKTFFKTSLASAPIFNARAEKVACGLYDPWEASRLNSKKLLADVGSSLLFGWTSLPIYLDVNYLPKGQPTSINKLIENGQVKFDMGFDQKQVRKSLTLNFGSFLNVPCSINISQIAGNDNSDAQTPYLFSGLTVNACHSNKTNRIDSPTGQVDSFKKTASGDSSLCGQCSINFQQAATFVTDKSFAPLRFILRLASSLSRYYTVKNDDTINPRQYNINQQYLTDAYKKYHSIPEACVPLLTQGLRCQSNMCEALVVREFEQKSGLEVEKIEMTKSMESTQDEYDMSYIKVKGCNEEIKLATRCSGNGSNFYLSYSTRFVQKCQKEVVK